MNTVYSQDSGEARLEEFLLRRQGYVSVSASRQHFVPTLFLSLYVLFELLEDRAAAVCPSAAGQLPTCYAAIDRSEMSQILSQD